MIALNKPLSIGGVTVSNPLWFAPLAAVSMGPVRAFYRKLGAGLTHTEMVSCAGLLHGNEVTRKMLPMSGEYPVVLQVFGDSPEEISRGVEEALSHGNAPDALEINMACPVRKVMRRREGAALLNYPHLAAEMIRSLKVFNIPLWSKIRLCGPNHPLSTQEFCSVLLEAGVVHISLHGRTPAQKYGGFSDRQKVGEIARAFPGVISGSGDVYMPEDILDYMREGCVAVLLARGAIRNPFLFFQGLHVLGYPVEQRYLEPDIAYRLEILLDLAKHMVEEEGERAAIALIKRFLGGLSRGVKGAADLRRTIGTIKDWTSLEKVLKTWESFISERGEYYYDGAASGVERDS